MTIHEYQAKKLFERFNVATPKGAPAETPEEGERGAAGLNTSNLVVKAQIHAGGRGKGTLDPFETPVCRMTSSRIQMGIQSASIKDTSVNPS